MISPNFKLFFFGIKDSLLIHKSIYHAIKVKEIRENLFKIILLNFGILFFFYKINFYICNLIFILEILFINIINIILLFPVMTLSYFLIINYY